jgi:hypothetical protein
MPSWLIQILRLMFWLTNLKLICRDIACKSFFLLFFVVECFSSFSSLTFFLGRFAAALAEDNLHLQQDLEKLQSKFAELTFVMHEIQFENQMMREQLKNLDSEEWTSHFPQQLSSSPYESCSNKLNLPEIELPKFISSRFQEVLMSSQSHCESLRSLLSNFVPFEQSAVAVEEAANLIFDSLISSSVTTEETQDPLNCKSSLQFVDGVELTATAASPSPAQARQASGVVAEVCEHTQIESYRDLLSSYEHELIAAWSRESDLHMQLRSACGAFSSKCLICHRACSLQPPSFPIISTSPSVDPKAQIEIFVQHAKEVLLETKISPSDSFFDNLLKLNGDQLIRLLAQQISSHNYYLLEMNRLK